MRISDWSSDVCSSDLGNTYKPLSGEQKEIGIKWQPLRTTMLRLSLYDLKESNALQPDPDNPLASIQTGSVKARGVAVQARSEERRGGKECVRPCRYR